MADERTTPLHEQPLSAERVRRESALRVAAIAAAQREGQTVPPAVLDYIIATSDWRQSQADLEMRAASVVQHVLHDSNAPDFRNAPAEETAAYWTRLGRIFGGYNPGLAVALAEAREETAAGPSNSTRFDGMYTGSDWTSPAGQRAMQAHAHRHGIPWAANHPDLLRLGPAALETLARTRFRQETYQSLRDAGFEARDAVGIARFAERTGQDANRVGQDTVNSIRIFGNGDPNQERLWREMLNNYYMNPEDAQARERLGAALRTKVETGTPEQQEHARRMQEIVRLAEQARLEAEAARAREAERVRADQERLRTEQAQRQAEEAAARVARERAAEEERNLLGAAPPAVVVREAPDGAPPAATPPPQRAAQAQAAPGGA